MAKRRRIEPGMVCRVADDGGISDEIRRQRVRVLDVSPGGVVKTSVQTGPARGSTYSVSVTELAACRRSRRRASGLGFIWPFTKPKRKLRVGEKRIYMIRTPSGKLLPVGPSAMQGARARRRKRR